MDAEKQNAMNKIKKMLNDVLGEMEEKMPKDVLSKVAGKMEEMKAQAEKASSKVREMLGKEKHNYYVVFTGLNESGERVFDNMYFGTTLKIFEGTGKGLQVLAGKIEEENLLKDVIVLNIVKMDDEVVELDD